MKTIRSIALACAALLFIALLVMPSRSTREVSGRKYPSRIPVRFWHMWSAEWKDVVDKIVDRYNRSQDRYEVIALSIPSTGEVQFSDTKFLLGAVGGDPPDVMAQWNPVIPTWADNQLLMPFEELMSPDEKATYDREAYPIVKRVGLYKGKTYGIPIGINCFALYYLPQHFREAGLDPNHFPKTLEEMTEVANRLTKRDSNGNLTRLGFLPNDWPHTAPLFGGGFYDFDKSGLTQGKGGLTLDRPENLRSLEYLTGLRRAVGFDNFIRFQAGLNTLSFGGGWPFIGQAYSICMDGQWRVEQIAKYAPNLEYRTAPMPPPKGGVAGAGYSNGNFMVIPRSAKEKAGAWDFVKFWSGISNPERAAEFYTMGGWLPLSDRVANAPAYQAYIRKYPQFQTFVDAVRSDKLQAAAPVPIQVFINDRIRKGEDSAIRGLTQPREVIAELKSAVAVETRRRQELGYRE